MAETLNDVLGAVLDAGDTETTSIPDPTPAPAAAEATPQQSAEVETPDKGAADFLGDETFDWTKVPPEQLPALKGFQKSYTQRMQDLAEQKKAFGDVDQSALAWTNQIRQLAQTDPAQAAAILRQQAEQLLPQGQATAQTPEFATDVERLLWERDQVREREVQELRMARLQAEVERSFDRLEKDYGRTITPEERNAALAFGGQHRMQVDLAWKVMNFENARRWGRDEGASVVAQKAGFGAAPGGVANREAPVARDLSKLSQKEAISLALDGVEI